MLDTEKTFLVTDSCLWEANRIGGTRSAHAIEVVDIDSGQVRYIRSGSKIKFLEGDITEKNSQEMYNEQHNTCEDCAPNTEELSV